MCPGVNVAIIWYALDLREEMDMIGVERGCQGWCRGTTVLLLATVMGSG